MTKLSIPVAVTAMLIGTTALGTTACDRNRIQREARDVEDAREDVREQRQEVREAETELQQEKAELSIEVQRQINDLQERYLEIEKESMAATTRLEAEGTRAQHVAEIEQARELAKTRLEEARQAKTPEEARTAIAAAEQAIDAFDRKVDQHNGNV